MSSLYTRKDSNYIYLRFYNKKTGKGESFKTPFLKDDKTDQKKAKEFRKAFDAGLLEAQLMEKYNVRIRRSPLLSEGLSQFVSEKSIPSDPKRLKPKTILAYKAAVEHFKAACGNKSIKDYSKKQDYYNFLQYLQDKEYAEHTVAIHLRHLHHLWNYFISQKFTSENIIEKIHPEIEEPEPIPYDDMQNILEYYRGKDKNAYHIIYYLLLTGCRISSAMVQLKTKIDMENRLIQIVNVKARKKKKEYKFPIYDELYTLLKEMNVEGEGRLFDHYSIGKNYGDALYWWYQTDMPELLRLKKIQKPYHLHQLRATFASYAINVLKMDIYIVQKLLDHTDIKITDNHYVNLEMARIKQDLDKSSFRKGLKTGKSKAKKESSKTKKT